MTEIEMMQEQEKKIKNGTASGGAAVAEMPAAQDDSAQAIDVDVDNMVWEVETEHAEDPDMDSGEIDPSFVLDENVRRQNYPDQYHHGDWDYYARHRYTKSVNKHLYTWLGSFVLGMYGGDRFLRGQIGLGVLKLLTGGGFGLWYMADLMVAFYKSYIDTDGDEDLKFDINGNYVD